MSIALPDEPSALVAILAAMADDLEGYLEQDGLYRHLVVQTPGHTHKPVMTLGLMLDARRAVDAHTVALSLAERDTAAAAEARIDDLRATHRSAFGAKLQREISSSLDSWSWYLDGCEHGDEDCKESYGGENWIRTRLANLMAAAALDGVDLASPAARLTELDTRLRSMFAHGPYSGPSGEEARYPADAFWWLYGRPSG